MTEQLLLAALIREVIEAEPMDEVWCVFCGVASWDPIKHTPTCWIVRATAAVGQPTT